MGIYNQIKNRIKKRIRKNFVQDTFDGNYPFNLKDIPFTKYKSFGEKNPDKVFYVIYRTPFEAGFFSNIFFALGHLKLIEGMDVIPVVDFQNFKTFYNNDTPINGTENSWEYYFEQLSPYSLEEVYQSKHVLFCDGQYPHSVQFQPGEEYKYLLKTFKLKSHVQKAVSQYDELFENNKVLGIHFRGKDMNIFPGHPFGPTIKQMFRYTDEIIEKYSIDKIFLATNETDYFNAFNKRYKDRVVSINELRTSKINPFNINPRENHRYLLGLEVLLDVIMLTKCYGLLHGCSNVVEFARRLNPYYNVRYSIYNGHNSNNKYFASFLYRIKKKLPKHFGGLLDKVEIIINEDNGQMK